MGKFVSNPLLELRTKTLVVALAAVDTGGGVLSVANPEGVECLITEVIIQVDTKTTDGTCTIDVGVAANGTTSNDTLLDGLDIGAAIGRFDNINDKGGNGGRDRAWGSTQYITGSKSTNATAGLVGKAIIHYRV
ncbi:hypothetical protein ES703_100509 [subsurface metagenome]